MRVLVRTVRYRDRAHPGLLATSAIVVALVAARMTETHRRLASVAVFVGAAAFVVGMAVAVVTDNGIY